MLLKILLARLDDETRVVCKDFGNNTIFDGYRSDFLNSERGKELLSSVILDIFIDWDNRSLELTIED